jgi:hypothetical protein
MATRWLRLEPYDGQPSRTVLRGRDRRKAALLPGIEGAFSKLKTFLRRVQARTREALEVAIGEGLQTITARDARGWFGHYGYQTTASLSMSATGVTLGRSNPASFSIRRVGI